MRRRSVRWAFLAMLSGGIVFQQGNCGVYVAETAMQAFGPVAVQLILNQVFPQTADADGGDAPA